ncbi:MAG: hypothetical protein FWC62_00235 [Firmicutes bacterium]|nr:hypothetical protein [Bacillota bacterium]
MKIARKIASIVLLVFAVGFLVHAVWFFIQCVNYVASLMSSGQLAFPANFFDIYNVYFTNFGPSAAYGLLLLGVGLLLWPRKCPRKADTEVITITGAGAPEEVDETADAQFWGAPAADATAAVENAAPVAENAKAEAGNAEAAVENAAPVVENAKAEAEHAAETAAEKPAEIKAAVEEKAAEVESEVKSEIKSEVSAITHE